MIYFFLSKSDSVIRGLIINFIKENIKSNNLQYKIIFCNQHIIESEISFINPEKDIVLWEPIVAYNNLEIVKSYLNSIVILERPSVYIQKISKFNPINENMAINHSFYLFYLNPDERDITNDEWKLVVKEEMYLLTFDKLFDLIKTNSNNH